MSNSRGPALPATCTIARTTASELCSFPFIKLPRTVADYLYGHMPSANAEPSPPPNASTKKGFAALLTSLNWKKDKKTILMVAGGAVLALVIIVVLIPHGSADANSNIESQMKSNPIQVHR